MKLWWIRAHICFVTIVTIAALLFVVCDSIANLEEKGYNVAVSIHTVKVIAWLILIFNGVALSVTFRRDCFWLFAFVTMLVSYAVAIGLVATFCFIIHCAMK